MYNIAIQHVAPKTGVPKSSLLRSYAKAALSKELDSANVTIRIVDVVEMTHLNETYRYKKGPTNVLSFPFSVPEDVTLTSPILGDVVICADIVNREASEQNKSQNAHWAHMIVHSIFHLLGYNHEADSDAKIMEALEIETLAELGFDNPYEGQED